MNDAVDKTKLIKEIVRLQKQIGHAVGQHALSSWMDMSLTIGQLKSLFFIDSERTTNLRKLAAFLGTTPPNVTGIVERLVEQGLVTRQDNPDDRRMLMLQTTDKSKALLAKLRENGINRLSGILAQLSLADLSALAQGLTALARAAQHNKEKTKDERNTG